MRSQMAMGLKMQYGSLAKDLNLDPKLADQVLLLLGDRQAALTEATFAAMKNGALDEAATREIVAKSEAVQKEYSGKLKSVIGGRAWRNCRIRAHSRYRMMLNMQEQQFSTAGATLETPANSRSKHEGGTDQAPVSPSTRPRRGCRQSFRGAAPRRERRKRAPAGGEYSRDPPRPRRRS